MARNALSTESSGDRALYELLLSAHTAVVIVTPRRDILAISFGFIALTMRHVGGSNSRCARIFVRQGGTVARCTIWGADRVCRSNESNNVLRSSLAIMV